MTFVRTPEQMDWIRERFKPDGLERLARADRDYLDSHGYYLGDVAALALDNHERLARAVWIAQHLFQMIDRDTWRATGGDDGQGHYEGDYHAENIREEIIALGQFTGRVTP